MTGNDIQSTAEIQNELCINVFEGGNAELVPDYGTFRIRLFTGKGILTSSVAYGGKATQINL